MHLIIDADDTLWENNIYFERAIEEFFDFLNHSTLTRAEARAALNEIERANAGAHGYGARAFANALKTCYLHLTERHLDQDEIATVMRFGDRILQQDIELIPGVSETLQNLSARHELTIFTKGQLEEQQMKIDRSGIADLFNRHEIVSEKNETSYLDLIQRANLDPGQSWMVGNSPKSDINPALAVGLGAVFIPHEHTWSLEHSTVDDAGDRLIVIERFNQLLDHF